MPVGLFPDARDTSRSPRLRPLRPTKANSCDRERSKYLGYRQSGEQQDEQDREQATDGHDDAAPAAVAPTPPYHALPAQREQPEVQEDGQAHAEHDAQRYPEEAPPTQGRALP